VWKRVADLQVAQRLWRIRTRQKPENLTSPTISPKPSRSVLRLRESILPVTTHRVQNPFSASKRVWLWPLIVAALIFGASSRSQIAEPGIPNIDKVAHFSVYGLLGTLLVRTGRGGRLAPWLALAAASFYGVTDEFHQSFVPGRMCEVADWVADTAGAALAILMYTRWPWYRSRLEMPVGRKRRIENSGVVATVLKS
jgi:VanZ family protein